MDILKLKDIVQGHLISDIECRDNDNLLVMKIWQSYYSDELMTLTASDLLIDFAENKLPSFESITRCRRKWQEEFPELRGEKYYIRLAEQEKVKGQIKLFNK